MCFPVLDFSPLTLPIPLIVHIFLDVLSDRWRSQFIYIPCFIDRSRIPWMFSHSLGNFNLSISKHLVFPTPSVAYTFLGYHVSAKLNLSNREYLVFPSPSVVHISWMSSIFNIAPTFDP